MHYNPEINSDQAIVTKVIEEAGKIQNSSLRRTTLQKVLYFLQVCDVPVRYRFDVHHYGPFCAEVLHDTEWLCELELIEDRSKNPEKYSDYHISDSGKMKWGEFNQTLGKYEQAITKVVEALVPMNVDVLELMSTLHYAYRERSASEEGVPKREEVIDRFKEFKKDRFDDKAITSACDRMEKAGLLSFGN